MIVNLNELSPDIVVEGKEEIFNILWDKDIELNILLKENSEVTVKNLILGDVKAKIKVIHEGKNSKSCIEAKNLVKGNSSFVAKTVINEEAINSETKQSINSLLLTPNARITALPILDIKNNEVIASHGAAIGTLDEELLFYMRSRGLNCKEAKEAIIHGYIDPFFQVLNEEQKKKVEAVI